MIEKKFKCIRLSYYTIPCPSFSYSGKKKKNNKVELNFLTFRFTTYSPILFNIFSNYCI